MLLLRLLLISVLCLVLAAPALANTVTVSRISKCDKNAAIAKMGDGPPCSGALGWVRVDKLKAGQAWLIPAAAKDKGDRSLHRPLRVGMEVRPGDIVQTRVARIRLRLANGDEILVAERSQFMRQEAKRTFTVLMGELLADVERPVTLIVNEEPAQSTGTRYMAAVARNKKRPTYIESVGGTVRWGDRVVKRARRVYTDDDEGIVLHYEFKLFRDHWTVARDGGKRKRADQLARMANNETDTAKVLSQALTRPTWGRWEPSRFFLQLGLGGGTYNWRPEKDPFVVTFHAGPSIWVWGPFTVTPLFEATMGGKANPAFFPDADPWEAPKRIALGAELDLKFGPVVVGGRPSWGLVTFTDDACVGENISQPCREGNNGFTGVLGWRSRPGDTVGAMFSLEMSRYEALTITPGQPERGSSWSLNVSIEQYKK